MVTQKARINLPIILLSLGLSAVLLGACSPPTVPITPLISTSSPEISITKTSSPTAFQPIQATITPDRVTVWISPALPPALRESLELLSHGGRDYVELVEDQAQARVRVEPDADLPLSEWVYAFVAPFPTVQDQGSLDGLREVWTGGSAGTVRVYASASTTAAMVGILGLPAEGERNVVAKNDLLEIAWTTRSAFALIPFEDIEPRWKVLELDGISPIDKDFDLLSYPLMVQFGLSGDPLDIAIMAEVLDWPSTNMDPDRMTVLVMTGTTALTRSTAWKMNIHGATYPGEKIGHWLREADLAHVSHEVAFTESCPPPDPFQASLIFCSDPRHLVLLEDIGVDLVELTGNHVMDYGQEAFLHSLEQYHQRGWLTFGGGGDLEDALQAALVEHNGNRLAFLGCNAVGPSGAWATSTSPGAAPCNTDRLLPEVERLRAEGYQLIFTFQWAEGSVIVPAQMAAFREVIDAGAVIVSGSQAHLPLGIEFYGDGFIHYGLGNLFFDQMQSLKLRQELIDRHVFYDGRYINTELLTAILEDYSQPRPMTPVERADFLSDIFTASGW